MRQSILVDIYLPQQVAQTVETVLLANHLPERQYIAFTDRSYTNRYSTKTTPATFIRTNKDMSTASSLDLSGDTAWALYDDEPLQGSFEISTPGDTLDKAVVTNVQRPWLFGFGPKTPNGRAVLILGGGGYVEIHVGREGIAVARWLNSLGFHAFVLVHRLPNAETGSQAPLDDARKALSLIKEKVDVTNGVGICGLSSGGHLGAALLSKYPSTWTSPSAIPTTPQLDFAIIGYGPISTNAVGRQIIANKPALEPLEKQDLYNTVQPDVQLPASLKGLPVFIVYSGSDSIVPVVNAYRLAQGITEKGGRVEMHVFADAPHGFALDTKGIPVERWPELCEAWLTQCALLD